MTLPYFWGDTIAGNGWLAAVLLYAIYLSREPAAKRNR